MVLPLGVIFSLGFVVASFVLIIIEERSGNIKHLQLICGMNKLVYWLCTYFWDLLWYTIFAILTLSLFLAYQDPFYNGTDQFPVFFLLLLCYGVSATPWMYMWSFLFKSPATAYVFLSCLNFLAGFNFLFIDMVYVLLGRNGRGNGTMPKYALLWLPFPSYTLGRSMMYLNFDRPLALYEASLTFKSVPSPYSQLSPFIVSMLIQSCIYSLVVVIIEASPLIINKM